MDNPEPIEVICPECGELIRVSDPRAFLLGLHERVCADLASLNVTPE
jgi:hypothetical protein